MNAMIAKYNHLEGDAELELSYAFDIEMYSSLLERFGQLSSHTEMIQHLDIYYTDNTRRTIVFVDGINQKQDSYMKKELLAKPHWFSPNTITIGSPKMKLNREVIVAPSKTGIKFIRAKLRMRFILDDKFDIELDLIKNINKDEPQLKAIKDSIFKAYGSPADILTQLFDELKVETEFKTKKISMADINRSIEAVLASV